MAGLKRPLTPAYIFFYLLFSEDSWRIAFGLAASLLLGPRLLLERDFNIWGQTMVYFMLTALGWWLFAYPAKKITGYLKQWLTRRGA